LTIGIGPSSLIVSQPFNVFFSKNKYSFVLSTNLVIISYAYISWATLQHLKYSNKRKIEYNSLTLLLFQIQE